MTAMKRAREEAEEAATTDAPAAKRWRPSSLDRLSGLSDELVLKVLSNLTVGQLAICHRLSHKFRKLAGDGQLWKPLYYNRFVRPRASRLPAVKELGTFSENLRFASKGTRWLDEEHLVQRGVLTDWKKQYKLRQNWSQGSCAVNEIPVAQHETIPPVLVQMSAGVIYMADREDGLRAWTAKGPRERIAQMALPPAHVPTSLAVDSSSANEVFARIIVGFEDGSFAVYSLEHSDKAFALQFTHQASSNGVIAAVAMSWPYAVTMTATQILSLYRFGGHTSAEEIKYPPRILHSLKSHTVWPPLSVSLRATTSAIFVCIAYTLPTYLSGWTVGVQEIKVALDGGLLDSRLASAIDQHYRPLAFSTRPTMHHLTAFAPGSQGSTALELRHIHSKPTSLSYTHPYLLVSHPDNTLTLYLVTSTADSLSVSSGSRLWGHTSAVSGASVGGKGKAISISRRGDELRVWELEGGFNSSTARKRLASGDLSIQIKPANVPVVVRDDQRQSGLDLVRHTLDVDEGSSYESTELTLSRGWIGFDEENVVVLKEHSQGRQALVVYDFT